ncbi:MAG: protein kinase domain-containing protein [Phycisphaeraceae bacterium]
MNTHTHDCDHKRIDAFLDSDRFGIEDRELTDHLGRCQACRAYLESRAASRGTWADAAAMLAPSAYDQASTVECSAAFPGPPRVEQPALIRQALKTLAPTDDPHRLGRIGEYEVTGVVGAGGMGVVLKAIDPSLDRVVAIKVMSPYLAHHGTARKRFEREAKAAAAVLHPNVVPIHSVYGGDPVPYLVMAYIRGGSLQKRLDREGPLPTLDILRIGSQVAAGLAAAHEQGLIHRDIKPENILLEEGVERVTITDFGLARTVDDTSITQTHVISGTPRYMSPEQARGDSLDQQTDLFSLGSVLYTLCTGRAPFRADTSFGVMRQINEDTPTPIREINPDIPDWLAYVVDRLMAKDKADRFGSAKEVHALLESCLNHAQQPTHTELPASLRKRQGPTKTRRGILPFLTSKHGVFTMIGLLTAGILTFTVPTLIDSGPDNGVNTDAPISNPVEGAIAGDLKLMQGDWDIVRGLDGGKPLLHDDPGTISVKDNALTMAFTNLQEGSERVKSYASFKLERGKPFNAIDLYDDKGTLRAHGIYELKGEALRVCLVDVQDGGRPESFASPKGTDTLLLECRQQIEEGLAGDLKLLQGEWEVLSSEQDGEKRTAGFGDNGFGRGLLLIKGNTFSITGQNASGRQVEGESGLIEIGSGTDPKSIDLISPNNPDDRLVGIYELKGETLRICWVEQSNIDVAKGKSVERPTTFESPEGSRIVLLELRKTPRNQGAMPDGLKPAQGMWEVTRSIDDNKPVLTNDKAFLSVTADAFTFIEVEDGEQVEQPIRLMAKIDPEQNPVAIDLHESDGTLRMIGIFEIQGNSMKLCFVEAGRDALRPAGFEPPVGNGARLIEMKRVGGNQP